MSDLIRAAVSAFLHPGGPYLFVRIVTAAYALSAIARLIPVQRKQVAGYRPKKPRPVALAAGTVAIAMIATACTVAAGHGPPVGHGTAAAPRPATPGRDASLAVNAGTPPGSLRLGVFEPGEWISYQPVARFAAATGQDPSLVLIYSGWQEPWQAHFAAIVHAHHAEPFVQMEPDGVSLQSIAAGQRDRYLKTYADQVRGYGHPVILSFAPEMNGDWYAWGAGHTPPRVFVAAWRHIVDLFRAEHARNVTWLWTVNSVNASKVPLRPWWPGAGYVDQVGIDGYFYRPADTFHTVFGTTIAQVRGFTQKPILISETAVGPVAGPAKVADLFDGARAAGLAGLVWFDQAQHDGIYHQDWRLEDNPAILAAFRRARSLSRTALVSRPAARSRPARFPPRRPLPPRCPLPPGPVPGPGAGPAYRLLVVRYRVLISGRVQGVFFRDSCRRLAEQHGLAGWVRNLPDGRVEAVFEGPAEDVRRLVDWAHTGPRLAVVDAVAVQPEPPEGLAAFHIK